ncbi:MAG TPA: MFS transporter [Streptosporangiaceae bacterium]|nr:MFS transporter [Streptosporangiaceae bacterium]
MPTRRARNAVYAVFFVAGFAFASWASRIPQVRGELRVTPGVLGLVLLCTAIGSTFATPLSGLIVAWLGESRTVIAMSLVSAAGLTTVAVGYTHGIPPVAAGLFMFGFGGSTWDVAMNVQGAAVEQALGRAIMPRFHAGWSIGTVAGAGVGAVMVALGVPVTAHLLAVALAVAITAPAAARRFLPSTGTRPRARTRTRDRAGAGPGAGPRASGPAEQEAVTLRRSPLKAWTEPRTLLIGVFVLCMTFSEGTGNDWLSLGIIGGYHTSAVLGTLTFAAFLAAMTAGRWFGPRLIDRHGRVRVLRACAATALAGLVLIEIGADWPVALGGAVLMGLGTSLGFPVGISAAADDPVHAPGRVSTAASIGYAAFLAGPPVIGFLADRIGVLHSLSVAGLLLACAFVLARYTAPIGTAGQLSRASARGE